MSSSRIILVALLFGGSVLAQSPSPSAPANSLSPAENEEAVRLLKSNFVDPAMLKEAETNRFDALLAQLHGGAVVLSAKNGAETAAPFFSEVLANHIAYVRLGTVNADSLRELDKALTNFGSKRVDAIALDLRASTGGDFDVAAEMAKRFAAKGKTLWTLRKPSAHQERMVSNDRDPVFRGPLMLLLDSETAGAAEAIAAALRTDSQAIVIGQASAGRGVEYADFTLTSGKILRIGVAAAISPGGQALFPEGIKPDIPVDLSLAQRREIFNLSAQRGMAPFVFESERPHFNEAALMAGTNPELDARQQRRNAEDNLHDTVLQRAVDVITSVQVFNKR